MRSWVLSFLKYPLPVLIVSVILVWLDWVIKLWVQYLIPYGGKIEVISGLQWVHWHNYGASFGMLSDSSGWQRYFFIVVAVLAIIGLSIWLLRLSDKAHYSRWSVGLILAGAVGNLIDRVTHGYVVDYVLFYYRDWYWPAFNLADAAISIGVAVLIWVQLFSKEET